MFLKILFTTLVPQARVVSGTPDHANSIAINFTLKRDTVVRICSQNKYGYMRDHIGLNWPENQKNVRDHVGLLWHSTY